MRALELYGYNLEYRLNSNDATDEQNTKANNIDNLSSLGKLLNNNNEKNPTKNN